MALGSNDIGLLFRMRGDSSEAVQASSDLRSRITNDITAIENRGQGGFSSLTGAMGLSSASAGVLTAGMAALAAVMAAQVTIAIQTVTGLFNLAKSASEAGSEIKDMQDKTGLTASTLSTLKVAAENAGSSFEQVGGGISKFAKLLGEAQAGNEKAQASLKALNVTNTDLDEGLKQVIKSIAEAKDGTEQITLAQKAFGKSGSDLIPVIKQINGDLEAAEKEAKRLGITLSDSDTKAADEFGDTLGVLSEQVSTAANRFALQFAPEITKALAAVSAFLADNQQIAIVWGGVIADVLRGVGRIWSTTASVITGFLDVIGVKFTSSAAQARAWAEGILLAINPVLAILARIGGPGKGSVSEGSGQIVASPFTGGGVPSGGGKGSGKSGADTAAENDRKDYQKIADELRRLEAEHDAMLSRIMAKSERDLAKGSVSETEFARLKMNAAEQVAAYKLNLLEKELAAARQYNQETADLESRIRIQKEKVKAVEFKNETEQLKELDKTRVENEKKYLDLVRKTISEREKNEKQALETFRQTEKARFDLAIKNGEDVLQNTIDAHTFLRSSYESDYQARLVAAAAERDRRASELEELKQNETAKREALAEINAAYDAEALAAKQELAAQMAVIDEEYAIPSIMGEDPFFSWRESLASFMETLKSAIGDAQTPIRLLTDAFMSVTRSIGSVISQWVMMGKTGPAVMRQILASALATIAAEAAVRAIYSLAMGFFYLATHQYTDATNAFISAAVFGSIAGVAAISGRAIAGNAFQQQAGGNFGQSSQSSSNSGQGRSSGGGAYSSNEDQVIEVGRNAPGGVLGRFAHEVKLVITAPKDFVVDTVTENIRGNGRLRTVIHDAL